MCIAELVPFRAARNGFQLTDDQLEAVSGGGSWNVPFTS
jgi:hypothetical protein